MSVEAVTKRWAYTIEPGMLFGYHVTIHEEYVGLNPGEPPPPHLGFLMCLSEMGTWRLTRHAAHRYGRRLANWENRRNARRAQATTHIEPTP